MKRAQYRMLGRLVRGERLPVDRFRCIGTVDALYRKALIDDSGTGALPSGRWYPTDLGRQHHADQKPRPPVRD